MKFTTRELLLVTAIFGLALGWWLDRRLLIYRYDDYINKHYNFKHMHTPSFGELFEPASDDPTAWRFHTKEGYDPFSNRNADETKTTDVPQNSVND